MLRKVSLISVGTLKDYFKKSEKYYKGSVDLITIKESDRILESKSILNIINKNKDSLKVLFDVNGVRDLGEINKLKNINKNIYFIVGGSEGVCNEIKTKCNYTIRLSSFTYPHQIFRLIALKFINEMFYK